MSGRSSEALAQREAGRDLAYSARDFATIRRIVAERTGIHLTEAKRQLVYSRLARRLRSLGLHSFSEYCALLAQDDEISECINAITTNVTAFFREPHHFEFLAQEALAEIRKSSASTRRVRIWSAGCSSGEEAYSIAIVVLEALREEEGWDALILATDIDSKMLEAARSGIYALPSLQSSVSKERLHRWFRRGTGARQGFARACPELRQRVRFRQLNLVGDWPMRGPFDVIFCRNVAIYFTKETKRLLFERFGQLLGPGGLLFLGHSETLHGLSEKFELVGRNVYRSLS